MADVRAESMGGGTTFRRKMIQREFPEPWSSTSLAKQAVLGTAQDIFVLDSAFALIEAHPPTDIRAGRRRPHPRHWQAPAQIAGVAHSNP
jgi:hypothetical protein